MGTASDLYPIHSFRTCNTVETEMLVEKQILALKPKARVHRVADGQSLFPEVTPAGPAPCPGG